MYARVSDAMAQFVLKLEKLSHIIGTAPILEMARAYGLRPRLWLLYMVKKYFLVHLVRILIIMQNVIDFTTVHLHFIEDKLRLLARRLD